MKILKHQLIYVVFLFLSLITFNACTGDDDKITSSEETNVTPPSSGKIKGFYLLNEGNMGSNKASLDYFDSESGNYYRNIYPTLNPTVALNLGDVGNDIQIYDDKLYSVINVSHYVEVMDLNTGKHTGNVTVTNCRYITFDKGYAYISSYNGPVKIEPNAPLGCVVKVKVSDMSVVDTCTVGYQPEEMVIRDNKLYVANSGGYRVPEYDNTISVIDLKTFKEIKKITVAINLHRLKLDSDGNIYASSRGDYKYVKSKTYIIDKSDKVSKVLDLPCSNMATCGDSIYVYSTEWSHLTGSNTVTYGIINTKTQKVVNRNFIADGTEKYIKTPYGLAINPQTREILVTDAKDYVSSGTLYCFSPNGKKKWEVYTGEIPAHIVFTEKRLITVGLLKK